MKIATTVIHLDLFLTQTSVILELNVHFDTLPAQVIRGRPAAAGSDTSCRQYRWGTSSGGQIRMAKIASVLPRSRDSKVQGS